MAHQECSKDCRSEPLSGFLRPDVAGRGGPDLRRRGGPAAGAGARRLHEGVVYPGHPTSRRFPARRQVAEATRRNDRERARGPPEDTTAGTALDPWWLNCTDTRPGSIRNGPPVARYGERSRRPC